MAKRDAPKASASKGKTKAQRHSAQTIANKKRAEMSRLHRLGRAIMRRESLEYTVPMNAEIPVSKLPKKMRDKFPADLDEQGNPIMVADPKRGMVKLAPPTVRDARAAQTARVNRKRTQRQNFAKLTFVEKREHREAGKQQFAAASA